MANEQVYEWDVTANGNDKAGALFPEGMRASDVNNNARQMQASIKTHMLEQWLQLDSSASRVNDRKFRVAGKDLRGIFKTQRRIRVGDETVLVVSSSYTGSATDVTIDRAVFKSNLTVYTLLPSDWQYNVISVVDGDYCFLNRIYLYKNKYQMCIKDTDNLTQSLWDDKANFTSIQGLDAAGVRALGFAQLKMTVTGAKLQIAETTK